MDAASFDATCTTAYNCCLYVEGESNPSSSVVASCQSTIGGFASSAYGDLSCSTYTGALSDSGPACQ